MEVMKAGWMWPHTVSDSHPLPHRWLGTGGSSRVTAHQEEALRLLVAFSFVLWGEFSDTTCQDPSIQSLGSASQHAAQPQRNSEGLGNETEHRGPGRTHAEQPGHVRFPGGCLPVTAASPVVLQSPWPANKVFRLFLHGNQARPLPGCMPGLWHSPFSSLETSTGWTALKAGNTREWKKASKCWKLSFVPLLFYHRTSS